MLKYLLDTHIAIHVIKRRPIEVMGVFNENAGRMAISAITLSELCHGAAATDSCPSPTTSPSSSGLPDC
jgi:predicted nucleic acid-binding protein